jgi:hypothetical protein
MTVNSNPTTFQLNMKKHPGSKFMTGVIGTVISLYLQISLRIFVKIRNYLKGILKRPGENYFGKKLKENSCQGFL